MLKGFPKTTSRFKDFQEDKEGLTGLSVESAHGYDLLQQENKKRNQQREKKHGAEETRHKLPGPPPRGVTQDTLILSRNKLSHDNTREGLFAGDAR